MKFGQKLKEKEAEAKKRNEISIAAFEQIAYNTVKRVNQNAQRETKKLKKKVEAIGQE